jgi:uncharacterized protein YndB with AHSA1/START domain
MSTRTPVRATVTYRFDAPAERVFDAWLSCDMLERWMFGPAVRDEEIEHLSLDPRAGGSFSFLVQRGEDEVEHVGKFLEVTRPRRLVFTWLVVGEKVGSRVLIDFEPRSRGCELTLTQELHPDWAEQVESMEAAWREMFEALAKALRQ